MIEEGDPHNFGQRVTLGEGASGKFFQKPRSVYWEWLLFGKSSPIVSILNEAHTNREAGAAPPDFETRGLFTLELEFTDPKSGGRSRPVVFEPMFSLERALRHFGFLLAYCYALGIRDLHRGNLVLSGDHPCVVDAEVVFADLLLPSETLLLPHKDVTYSSSGLSHIIDDRSRLTPQLLTELLTGFEYGFRLLDATLPKLRAIVTETLAHASHVPVRHIVRDTAKYRAWRSGLLALDLIPEELEQLKRGDIPYFFKFLGERELYYYTSRAGGYQAVQVPGPLFAAVAREAQIPTDLIESSRFRKKLFPTGALYLARTFLDPDYQSPLSFGLCELVGNDRELTLTSPWGRFSSAKARRLT